MSSLLMSVWRERVSVTSSAPSTLAVSSPRPRPSPATTPDLCFSSNSLRTNPSLYKSGPLSLTTSLISSLFSLCLRVCVEYSLTSLLRAHSQNLFSSHSISLQLVCHYLSLSFSLSSLFLSPTPPVEGHVVLQSSCNRRTLP